MATTGRSYTFISADSHLTEPPDMWDKWLEKKYLPLAPRVVKDPDGGDAWQYNPDAAAEPLGLVTCVGVSHENLKPTGVRFGREIHPACYDGTARLAALDVDGIDAEVLYPNVRASHAFTNQDDPELHIAGLNAYHRWLMEDFCGTDPARLVGIAQMPNLGIETAVAELRQAKHRGFRGVVIYHWPSGNAALSREDDPFWAEAEDLGIPVSIHLSLAGASSKQTGPAVPEAAVAIGAGAFAGIMPTLMQLIFTGVYDRFPSLHMVAVETGVGWIPHFLEMVDDRYWRNRNWNRTEIKKVPSQYFKDNWLATFIVDRIGVQIRHAVGLRNMAWSTDFPHHGNDWPHSRQTVNEHFVNVPDDERDLIVSTNAAKLYGLIE